MKIKILFIILILAISAGVSSAISVSNLQIGNQTAKSEIFEQNNSELYNREELLSGRTMINLIKQLDEKMMQEYLENITSFGPRVTDTAGCDAVASYIYNEFENMDVDVRYHNWTDNALSGKNIEATLEGTDESNDEVYIICGHYDGVPETVGADDNGAGTVSVLSAAKIMSQYEFDHTIRFVLFSGEEQGLYGSYYYALDAAKNNDEITAVINIDMTGFATNVENGHEVILYENIRSSWISQKSIEMSEKFYKYINLEIIVQRNSFMALSDHFSFWQNNYDAVFLYENEFNPDFHTPGDNLDTVNISYATKIARLSLATIADLSKISNTLNGETLYVGGTGPGNYSKIMDAVKNSSTGDTIYVYNGTYNEQVIISKSIDIIGEGSEATYVHYNGDEPAIILLDGYTVVCGFNIKNIRNQWCSPGMDILSDNNVILLNNISSNKGYGIGLIKSSNNYIRENTVNHNKDGIVLWTSSEYNRIHYNEISNNEVTGILLAGKSHYTCLKWNLITNNKFGIYTQAGYSDSVGNPSNTNIYNNIFTKNEYCTYLNIYSKNNKIIFNNFTNNKVGIYFGNGCNKNKILKNNFIKNDLHTTFDGSFFNIWIRNHWDNRTINIGPKIIRGSIKNMPFKPAIRWINIDIFPAVKPHKIEL